MAATASASTAASTRCPRLSFRASSARRSSFGRTDTRRRSSVVTFAEGGPKRGGTQSRGERNGDVETAPPLRASAAFLCDPHCDVVRDDDNALAFRCPPGPEEDPELGPSYRTMAFDFAEEEKKMGLDPGECVIGEGEDGMPSIDCGS